MLIHLHFSASLIVNLLVHTHVYIVFEARQLRSAIIFIILINAHMQDDLGSSCTAVVASAEGFAHYLFIYSSNEQPLF